MESTSGNDATVFSVVRYGNVMGSRGSVIPYFRSLTSNSLPITHAEMTRFMITLEQGVNLVWEALSTATCGEIYVKKIPSMKVVDIARAIRPDAVLDIIGIRPGEKLHEQMIGIHDAPFTYDFGQFYKIYPNIVEPKFYEQTLVDLEKFQKTLVTALAIIKIGCPLNPFRIGSKKLMGKNNE